MGLYKRGRTWWMCFQVGGRQVQKSTGTQNRKLATEIYAKARTMVVEGEWFNSRRAKTIRFGEMADKYFKKHAKERDFCSIKHLLPCFEAMKLSDITAEKVEDYVFERAEKGAKPATIYQEFALGRRMFNVARKKWKWISFNPFADVEFSELLDGDNSRERWLTFEEEEALLKNASPAYLRDVIVFALHSGCRRGEILSLSWKDNIDMRRRVVMIRASKGGDKKSIPMSRTLYQVLLERAKVRHISGKVFPVTVAALKDAFERAVKKAGLEDFRFHDLRHSFATRLVQSGVDLYAVKKLLGHKSIKMTERYAHHYPESLRSSVEALDELAEPKSYDNFMTI